MQNKLYSIGTQLIMHRLSQTALCAELFPNARYEWFDGQTWREGLYFGTEFKAARVYVDKENQKWLSPVPIVGDDITWLPNDTKKEFKGTVTDKHITRDGHKSYAIVCNNEHYGIGLENVQSIKERTYPNGQRAPLIEWDEVAEP